MSPSEQRGAAQEGGARPADLGSLGTAGHALEAAGRCQWLAHPFTIDRPVRALYSSRVTGALWGLVHFTQDTSFRHALQRSPSVTLLLR